VGGLEHLLIGNNSRVLELVLDGAELVIGIQWLGALGEGRRVRVLEVPECSAGLVIAIATIVVVGGNLSEVLEGGEVGLTLGACSLTVF
jgi:hypothetical protein